MCVLGLIALINPGKFGTKATVKAMYAEVHTKSSIAIDPSWMNIQLSYVESLVS